MLDDYLIKFEFGLVELLHHVVRTTREFVVVALAGAEHEGKVLNLLGHHVLHGGRVVRIP